ncbi:hypothetical protein GMA11_07670 [Granulicatella sp. zg-ZJ]|uniref:UPF0223 family protein n=1 Tax=unclassified Granulicatella TaxID=2630493 RepID=UPI0013BF0C67|nr:MULTISPECIES: UPF0223 family protein [unclassified Granulicatella]NEW63271.1 hypothetical protein [Granulicatella sp. zg-ZJ]NEW66735.1 hypothetical protein [Granulicatella sp. zg-84]QMI85421.1 UPF0223 family protein [Carnobacteriaceae bacterium zg-84]
MTQQYEYPIDYTWTQQEMTTVITLFNAVESAYEKGVDTQVFLKAYQAFKQVVPSKSEEKQLGNTFEKRSGYSLYKVWKKAQETPKKIYMEK